jgi:intracellular septation protein
VLEEVNKKEGYRSILEMGPLLLFFGINYFYGIMAGTAVLVISTLLSLALSWYWFKNIPMMAAAGCVAVVFFGGLTIFFDDEFFIKIKPTIVSIIIAGVLASGKILGRNPLAAIMKSAVNLDNEGWNKLTWLWVVMFIIMAVANEIAWRNLTTDQWVSFKAFGIVFRLRIVISANNAKTSNKKRLVYSSSFSIFL